VAVKQDSAPEMLRESIQGAIRKVDRKQGVMLFTDMFGGPPPISRWLSSARLSRS